MYFYDYVKMFLQEQHVSNQTRGHHQASRKVKGKAIPLQALTGPKGSRRLRLPDFKTIGTRRW
jgi:hypothetical protein